MSARVALMGGMGYPLTETQAGMPTLKTRLETLAHIEVLLVNWAERQQVYNFLHGFDGFRALAGDSLGAGSAAQYAGDLKGDVQFVAGFQPSLYDSRAVHGYITVAANVTRATCIYDPRWIDTMGLGNAQYIVAHGAKTKLMTIQHHGAHPDDWGWSQNVVFEQLKGLISGH